MYTWRNWRGTKNIRELENVREATSYAIQSQYSASEKILALAAGFQARIDPHADIDLFYDKMFNIYTAEGVGLDNWGVILGIGRTIEGPPVYDCFGFFGSELAPFNQKPFVPDLSSIPPFYITLGDESFRLLLLYKALANISASDAATQNKLLSVLIDTGAGGFSGAAYVLEVGTMVIRWVFETFLTAEQLAIFRVAGTLARGAGVGWELFAVDPKKVFGFFGSNNQPFNQAQFVPDKSLVRGV
ncbi:MAG: DUF2612 domain-containing protein [Candidatus Adiutrix sp.]|jgi:hypothetical protein|nr:DUF2612 domain-containing protein [Candidatus Adiutrix sp.]